MSPANQTTCRCHYKRQDPKIRKRDGLASGADEVKFLISKSDQPKDEADERRDGDDEGVKGREKKEQRGDRRPDQETFLSRR